MVKRRQIIRGGVVGGAALLIPAAVLVRRSAQAQPVPGGTLDPARVAKYVTPLFVLPAMPSCGGPPGVDSYSIAVRQFNQQVLPPSFPVTPVFGFGSTTDSGTFHAPAYTIEARVSRPVRVTWANQLVTSAGDFRPSLVPVDQTLHWANPPGGLSGRDMRSEFTRTPGPYRGPVPLVTHLHGAHAFEENDGYPEAWYLPVARNIPRGYATVGTYYDRFKAEARSRIGVNWAPGTAVYQYQNDQRATNLWYHSHELGMTRTTIYSGLSGMYLLRGGPSDLPPGVLPGPAPRPGESSAQRHYEVPMVIQDRSFNTDGTLFFPASRGFFGDTPPNGPFIPTTDVPPQWNPEFFGNTIVVNGRTWPVFNVEARRYRLRLLNACNTRVLLLKVATSPTAARPAAAALPIWVIGTDGGLLPAPVPLTSLRIGVAERADVIVDFTGVPAGTSLYLINEGPDEPYGGGEPGVDFEPADIGTTGQVLKFQVSAPTSTDPSTPPAQLHLPPITPVGPAGSTRQVSLNELDSGFFPEAPIVGRLGVLAPDGTGLPLEWMSDVTEHPALNSTEIWEMYNFTEDGHPIHIHQVQFQVVNRQPFGGVPRPPEVWETGFKDTLIALPSEITRVRARFDIPGRFVWHCHIIDHEDNEMMRPYQVG